MFLKEQVFKVDPAQVEEQRQRLDAVARAKGVDPAVALADFDHRAEVAMTPHHIDVLGDEMCASTE